MHVKSDLAVITCHFNWFNYNRPKYNLNGFLRQMDAVDIPVYGAEASLDGNFVTKDNKNWVHLKAEDNNICWQKEALLNLAETIVPEKYTKIAWIDHDLNFTNLNWYDEASEALDKHKLIQLFEQCYLTDIKGNIERHAYAFLSANNVTLQHLKHKKLSCWVDNFANMNVMEVVKPVDYIPEPPILELTPELKKEKKLINNTLCIPFYKMVYHVGFAFAVNRSLWKENIKLFPYFLLGSGDIAIISAVFNHKARLYKEQYFDGYQEWVEQFYRYIGNNTGYIKGSVYHAYHGSRKNRGYDIRHSLVQKHNFNFKNNLFLENGLLVIKDAPEFALAVKDYFKNRNEDI